MARDLIRKGLSTPYQEPRPSSFVCLDIVRAEAERSEEADQAEDRRKGASMPSPRCKGEAQRKQRPIRIPDLDRHKVS